MHRQNMTHDRNRGIGHLIDRAIELLTEAVKMITGKIPEKIKYSAGNGHGLVVVTYKT